MNLRSLILLWLWPMLATAITAQRDIPPTDHIIIDGAIKTPVTFTLHDLQAMPAQPVSDVPIYNHMGEAKDTLRGLEGIPIKTLFQSIDFMVEKPRELNEFYFVFEASDGYRVVFSWNELFNTNIGDQLFVLTTSDGRPMPEMPTRIATLSTGDQQSGRRYVKGLSAIPVKRL